MAGLWREVPLGDKTCLAAVEEYVRLLNQAGLPFYSERRESTSVIGIGWGLPRHEHPNARARGERGADGAEEDTDSAGMVLFAHYGRTIELLAQEPLVASQWLNEQSRVQMASHADNPTGELVCGSCSGKH
ncbi:MAG: hypothetical protein KatS3mg109_0289 [Pirellulaceae bacterium]|nr:MAG: hypothetical protein KatS3mg109_0289 [Pirellulaceae bacterium]